MRLFQVGLHVYLCGLILIIYTMATFTFTSWDGGYLQELREHLASDESLRLHFKGTLSSMKNLCSVTVMIPENIRLKKKGNPSFLSKSHGGEIVGTVEKLPKFQDQLNEQGHLIVDFEAYVFEIKGDKVKVLLPDSYRKPDNGESMEGYNKETHTLTIKTEQKHLLEMLEKCLDKKPVAHFYGELSEFDKNKVTVSLPSDYTMKTEDGGKVSVIGSAVTLAVINNLPRWREQSKGVIGIDFYAVITSVSEDSFTIKLPEWYNEKYKPVANSDKWEWLTKKVSEEQAFAAIRFRNAQYEYAGFSAFENFSYDTDLFDMDSNKFDLDVLEDLDKVDIEGINYCIREAYFNTLGITYSRFGQKCMYGIWADWDLYGYKDVTEVPLSIAAEITEDSTICVEFFNGKLSLTDFLNRDDVKAYAANRPVIVERLERIDERKKQRKRP